MWTGYQQISLLSNTYHEHDVGNNAKVEYQGGYIHTRHTGILGVLRRRLRPPKDVEDVGCEQADEVDRSSLTIFCLHAHEVDREADSWKPNSKCDPSNDLLDLVYSVGAIAVRSRVITVQYCGGIHMLQNHTGSL